MPFARCTFHWFLSKDQKHVIIRNNRVSVFNVLTSKLNSSTSWTWNSLVLLPVPPSEKQSTSPIRFQKIKNTFPLFSISTENFENSTIEIDKISYQFIFQQCSTPFWFLTPKFYRIFHEILTFFFSISCHSSTFTYFPKYT